jgi:GMP synthase (glutamine-hydrolysing)
LRIIDATERFLQALAGITFPHEKRVAMRKVYKEVLEEEIQKFNAAFIAQGTLYTDISESGRGYDVGVQKAQIKLHHNVDLAFSVEELCPLADQVKDTGRNIGRAIEVPEVLLTRHPFPGPGLVIRISGEVTADKLKIARQLDGIFIEELRNAGLYEKVWQAFVRITEERSTCTKGDDAASGIVVIPVAVSSVNGFTAQPSKLPDEFWDRVVQRMVNEVREVARVCPDRTPKPPATIEFE